MSRKQRVVDLLAWSMYQEVVSLARWVPQRTNVHAGGAMREIMITMAIMASAFWKTVSLRESVGMALLAWLRVFCAAEKDTSKK